MSINIKQNGQLIKTAGLNSQTVIVDNLTTNDSTKALSANQGKVLKDTIDGLDIPDALSDLTDDSTHRLVTDTEKSAWDAKSNFSGSYNDLTNKPTLGTASAKNVPSSGNASSTEVVMGNDSRLTDSRTPTAHNQASSTINAMTGYSKPSEASAIADTDTLNAAIGKLEKGLDGKGTSNLTLGESESTAYRGDRGKTAYDHSQSTHARTDATKTEASSTNGNIQINGTETTVYTHPGSGTNPHGTTKSDVGLGNVGNFKAVSTEASQGLTDTEKSNARSNIGAGTSSFSGSYSDLSNKPTLGTASAKDVPSSGNASTSQVVIGNDTRLTDARNAADVYSWAKASTKPTYTASEVGAIATTAKGSANGVAELDNTGKVPSSQLPSYVDDVIEGYYYNSKFYSDSAHTTEITPETGKIYVDISTDKTYRWSGTAYAQIKGDLALGETSTTAYRGDRGKTAYDHSQSTHARTDATAVASSSTNGNIKINGTETTVYTHPGSGTNPHGTTKSDVGLGNVGNFKAVSTEASQGLTSTEQSNARANIGAGTSSFSGSYTDLSNKPTLGTAAAKDVASSGNASTSQVVMGNDTRLTDSRTPTAHNQASNTINAMTGYSKPSSTSAIGTSDTLNSAIGKLEKGLDGKTAENPTFTEASTRANIASGESYSTILGKIKKFFTDLKTVAFSGSYNDLSDKPTIPTVNNGTLTIQKNGTSVATFTANQSGNSTANIDVPNVIDNLTSTSTTDALSANQGRVLKNTKLEESANNVLGAKNLLPMTVASIKSANTSGTWSGNAYTFSNVTFTILTDSDNNVTGISINGTNSTNDNLMFNFGILSELTEGTSYIYSSGNSTGSSTTYAINIVGVDTQPVSMTFTQTSALSTAYARFVIRSGKTVDNQIFYPMIRLASYTDSTFEPYAMTNLALTNKKADKSELPTVNNGTLTIQKNGTNVATFSANQSSNATANILVDELTELTDTEPYTLRQGKGDMVDFSLEGASVAWNQLVQNSDSSVTVPNGHKYIRWNGSALSKATSDGTAISVTGGTDKCYDVTQMFGTTIADTITTEVFAKYFPNYTNYAYDAGSIQSVNVASRKVVGKNLFDKSSAIDGYRIASDGQPYSASGYALSDWIEVEPSTNYVRNLAIQQTSTSVALYDANKTFIERVETHSYGRFTTTETTKYIRSAVYLTDKDNCQIEYGTTATSYEPYEEHIANFDATKQLRGIPSLVNNKLVYDGDIYTPNGITRKYGIVDLGTLTWGGTTPSYYSDDLTSVIKKPATNNDTINAICSIYPLTSRYNMFDKCVTCDTSGRIYGRDATYNDYTAFKTAMNGVYLVYELATPTMESAEPYQNPQRADASGTEEFIDFGVSAGTRDVSIPCGHNSTYKSSEVIQPLEDYVDGYRINEIRDDVAWYENNGFLSKNLLPVTLASVKNANSGSWLGNVCTIRGVTFTVNTNNEGYVTTIVANNTATGGNANFYIPVANNIYKGCILSGLPKPTQSCNLLFQLGVSPYTTNVDSTGDGVKITIDNGNSCNVILQVPNNVSVSNLEFKPMIRYETTEDDSYTPYAPSNLELLLMIPEKLYATGSFTSSTSDSTTVTVTNSNISIDNITPLDVYTDMFGLEMENMTVSGSGNSATITIIFPKTESAQTINYRVYVKTI